MQVVRALVKIPYKVGHLKGTTNRQKRTWGNSSVIHHVMGRQLGEGGLPPTPLYLPTTG
jgi:hypothetical protein